MLSIKARIVTAYTLVFGLALCGFAWLIERSSLRSDLDRLDARLETHADKVETEMAMELHEGTFPLASELRALRTTGLDEVRLQIYDSLGRGILPDSMAPLPHTDEWRRVREGQILYAIRTIGEQRDRVSWQQLQLDGGRYVLELASSLEETDADLARLLTVFLVTIPTALLIAAAAAFLILRSGFRPIAGIIETARSITASDLDQSIPLPHARDEVHDLAVTLNDMIRRLGASFAAQKQFVADASHEIRTPLTIIKTELEYAERADDPDEVRESVRIALGETDNLTTLSSSLLMLVRLDSSRAPLRLAPCRLDQIAAHAVERVAMLAAGRDVAVHTRQDGPVTIDGDAQQLERVVLNLLDNAIKYSPRGSSVSVGVRAEGSEALLSVEDHGTGMSQAELARVFERFHRAERARSMAEGFGLGLAITRRIVELHGGTITMSSAPGAGTTAVVRLPSLHESTARRIA
jgi:two-component system OmpR family sensor kinase